MTANELGASWLELRDAATAAASRGWPIVPGTHVHQGRWYGRPGATGLVPVVDDWQHGAITDADQALRVWTGRPYGVLLVCGQGVDVVELPLPVAARLPEPDRSGELGGPIAVVFAPLRWLVFVTSGAPLEPRLAALDVRIRAAGEWVALPPTPLGSTQTRWRIPPSDETTLPDSARIQRAITEALASHRTVTVRSCPR